MPFHRLRRHRRRAGRRVDGRTRRSFADRAIAARAGRRRRWPQGRVPADAGLLNDGLGRWCSRMTASTAGCGRAARRPAGTPSAAPTTSVEAIRSARFFGRSVDQHVGRQQLDDRSAGHHGGALRAGLPPRARRERRRHPSGRGAAAAGAPTKRSRARWPLHDPTARGRRAAPPPSTKAVSFGAGARRPRYGRARPKQQTRTGLLLPPTASDFCRGAAFGRVVLQRQALHQKLCTARCRGAAPPAHVRRAPLRRRNTNNAILSAHRENPRGRRARARAGAAPPLRSAQDIVAAGSTPRRRGRVLSRRGRRRGLCRRAAAVPLGRRARRAAAPRRRRRAGARAAPRHRAPSGRRSSAASASTAPSMAPDRPAAALQRRRLGPPRGSPRSHSHHRMSSETY